MAKKKSVVAKPTFEQSLAQLEAIVRDLEGGDLGLAEALSRYEGGVKHLKACYELLQRAERRIEQVSGVDADGNAVAEPFAVEENDDLTEKAAARGKKRSADARAPKRRRPPQVDDGETLF